MTQERPIIFSAPMVNAILAGQKTQTRRIIKQTLPHLNQPWHSPVIREDGCHFKIGGKTDYFRSIPIKCPYGKIGDLLWVRETFAPWQNHEGESGIDYKASPLCNMIDRGWKPSTHMPRWASRITLRITNVRVERLQDISEDDARAEGCPYPEDDETAKTWFKSLWQSLNGNGSWDANPYVWVFELKTSFFGLVSHRCGAHNETR